MAESQAEITLEITEDESQQILPDGPAVPEMLQESQEIEPDIVREQSAPVILAKTQEISEMVHESQKVKPEIVPDPSAQEIPQSQGSSEMVEIPVCIDFSRMAPEMRGEQIFTVFLEYKENDGVDEVKILASTTSYQIKESICRKMCGHPAGTILWWMGEELADDMEFGEMFESRADSIVTLHVDRGPRPLGQYWVPISSGDPDEGEDEQDMFESGSSSTGDAPAKRRLAA